MLLFCFAHLQLCDYICNCLPLGKGEMSKVYFPLGFPISFIALKAPRQIPI